MSNTDDKQAQLQQIFYDPSKGLSSAAQLYKIAKAVNPKITQKDVKAFIQSQSVKQIHREIKAPKHYFPIKSGGKDHIWTIDLADTSRDAHFNSGINWLFVCVDIATRYAWIVPMKNKEASTVTKAFESILAELNEERSANGSAKSNGHSKPEIIMSDNDSAFISRSWKAMTNKYGIEMSFAEVGDHHKQGIIEAFIRTLRRLIESYRTAYKTKRYIDVIPQLLDNYNHRPHASLGGSTPAKPDLKRARIIVLAKEEKASEFYNPELFPEGAEVRYVLNRNVFERGSLPKWSAPHKVEKQDGRNFTLDNGNTYNQLQPIRAPQEAPPLQTPDRPASPPRQSKKYRLALQQEGVEESSIKQALRPRAPANQLISNKGERIIWS